MIRLLVLVLLAAVPGWADSVVPIRTIRAHAIIAAEDVTLRGAQQTNGFAQIADVAGQEARVVLYPGRPIRSGDIGPPAVVTRNQLVRIVYSAVGLEIAAEARALERGAIGDLVRVMNLSSRATITGQIQTDGSIRVSP